MKTSIDSNFMHFGIRKDDLTIIEALCGKENIDFNWLSEEILKPYHARKVDFIEIDDAATEDIIRAAIEKIER